MHRLKWRKTTTIKEHTNTKKPFNVWYFWPLTSA